MRILYIDTTTSYLYAGIVSDNVLLSEIKEDCGKDLSKCALAKIKNMLDEENVLPTDIDKIIVVNGPGSYTGIRIGVTIAKTFAYSLKKDITTVSSLEVMAISSMEDKDYIVPMIDARRNYYFAAIYDRKLNPILKEQYISYDALRLACDHLLGEYTLIGNCKEAFEKYDPDILKIVNTFKDRESIDPHLVNPIYLKLTEAEENNPIEVI